ncbi:MULTISPECIES: fluoride efflux transporter CrcB [unclassified Chelatococcus]|uniref:fluoride efflux transporter CrcB n=1 Tax=unclassified Chelatococcus TaxID=2638111 RepID=UPI001BCFCB0A|nr:MULTISPECIES: fluoride efflux transporter CrcB [unclassified Chelatococcus]MBS7698204.1 fluoride efflux transporter CrcB [Chelatococcus sp. YT9]MBX3559876.1 fluoride efflux transporter CrcB [Chelatococcus sp.]
MQSLLLVFLGAGLGGCLRHIVSAGIGRLLGAQFPWGIFVINVTGSFAMGLVAGWLAFKSEVGWSQPARLFMATGVLGGYTTFSSFSLDAVVLWERGEWIPALGYVLGSVVISILALAAGLAIVRNLA